MECQSDWVLPKDQPMQERLEWYAKLEWWCQEQWECYGRHELEWAAHQHQQYVLQWAAWQHQLQYQCQQEGLRHEEGQGLRHEEEAEAEAAEAAEAAEEPQYAAMWNVRSDLTQKDLHNDLYEFDAEPDYIVKVEVLDGAFLLCYSTHPHQAKTMCHALDGMDHLPSNGRLRMEMFQIEIMNAYPRMEAFRRETPPAAGLRNPFCLSKA